MKAAGVVRCGRTWVAPNRNTIGLVALLAAMGYAGAGQTNAAAYLLGFLLAAMAAISVAHGYANIRGVQLAIGQIRPVFAGEKLRIPVVLALDSPRPRFGLELRPLPRGRGAAVERLSGTERPRVELELAVERRGRWNLLEVEIRSHYPLGFFSAFRRISLRAPHLVYPRPAGDAPLPDAAASSREAGVNVRAEGEDFAGLRTYQAGESQRHIDWKAVARGQPLLTRQWAGVAPETVLLDLKNTDGDLEARVSQLARWVVIAEQNNAAYGLRLSGLEIAPARGNPHFHACLRALAVFEEGEERAS